MNLEKINYTKELLLLRNYEYIKELIQDNSFINSIVFDFDEVIHMFGHQQISNPLMITQINEFKIDFQLFFEDVITFEQNEDIYLEEFEQFLVANDLKVSPIVDFLTKLRLLDYSFLVTECIKELNVKVIEELINEKKEFLLKNKHLLEVG